MLILRRFYPLMAFFGGFVWDVLTIGQKVRNIDFLQLGVLLFSAALLALWMAWREDKKLLAPPSGGDFRSRLASLRWQAPYLVLQFCFGGIFSALFIFYFKSTGHFASWVTTLFLGILLVGNEFAGQRYGRRFTLTWSLFALNAMLLLNFALPHWAGSLNSLWFYVSTAAGLLLAHGLQRLAPGQPGSIRPAWGLAFLLLLAWTVGMIPPVPLVKRDIAVGQGFVQDGNRYVLQIEEVPKWFFWRQRANTVHVQEGGRLYGVSAVYAPLGVKAELEHRWEVREAEGWRQVSRNRFQSSGGREHGFRGYSWVLNPQAGQWRLIVAVQDGRTIGVVGFEVKRADSVAETVELIF